MRTIGLVGLGVAVGAALGGCSSSSNTVTTTGSHDVDSGNVTTNDSGTVVSSSNDAGATKVDATSAVPDASQQHDDAGMTMTGNDASHVGTSDAGHDAVVTGTMDAGSTKPTYMLVTYTGATNSETVVVDMATKAISGRIPFAGFGVTDGHNVSAPYLLEQNADIVAKLDSTKPWQIDSTWNVLLTDGADGGSLYADPYQVVSVSATKAYVLRYDRNAVGVINEGTNVDGGAPTSSIDLSGYLQTDNAGGVVEMSAAAYIPSMNRVYVALANFNQALQTEYNGVICGNAATVIAIDTQNDTLVDLGGTGPKGSIALTYANPVNLAYDSVGGRLLIVGAGCYAQPTAGGTIGAAEQRGVEAISLSTSETSSLLALNASAFPSGFVDMPTGFVYIDSTHAVLGFDQTGQAVYSWNPTSTTIGSVIPNAPDVFTYDGNGNLVGTRLDVTDAGVSSTALVSVAVSSGASTTIASNATSLTGTTYVASVDVWPHP